MEDRSGALRHTETVTKFLEDDHVRSLLRDPSLAFTAPSDATKSDFETRTAANQVTPTKNEHYDTDVIKADATWLSKAANINLVSALRIVIVEFQSRPATQLTGPLSAQDAINLQEALGVSNAQSSSLAAILGATRDADAIWADFGTEEARRLRIFQTYLAERRYLAMTVDLIHGETLCGEMKRITSGQHNLSEPSYPSLEDQSNSDEVLVSNNMKMVTRIIESMANGYKKDINDKSLQTEDAELDWQRTLLTELVHALSVIFQTFDHASDFFAAPETVMEWFSLMETYVFLSGIVVVRAAPVLHCVSSAYPETGTRKHPFSGFTHPNLSMCDILEASEPNKIHGLLGTRNRSAP